MLWKHGDIAAKQSDKRTRKDTVFLTALFLNCEAEIG